MTKKCSGCGSTLQFTDKKKDGYIKEEKYNDSSICERCFKIKNYGEYTVITEKIEFDKIIEKINDQNKSVVFVVDVLNINFEVSEYIKKFKNKKYIVLSKRDLIPKSVKDNKIINYFKNNFCNIEDVLCVSAFKNKNIDLLLNILKKNKEKEVYFVGFTNSGKSSLINSILSSLGSSPSVTTSPIPNTTINFIEIKIDKDLTIIDTPGFVLSSSIYNYISYDYIKKITPLKEIKVKIFQIKPKETIFVDNLLRIDYLSEYKNSFSFYMNDKLVYERMKTTTRENLITLPKKNIHLNEAEDILINGLGFIKVSKECDLVIYTLDESLINIRKSLI